MDIDDPVVVEQASAVVDDTMDVDVKAGEKPTNWHKLYQSYHGTKSIAEQ